jgi:hypothetical protein
LHQKLKTIAVLNSEVRSLLIKIFIWGANSFFFRSTGGHPGSIKEATKAEYKPETNPKELKFAGGSERKQITSLKHKDG